jgi:hypothetical protein
MEPTQEHLEHVEHAQHHTLSSFDRRVAVTVAIIATVLAGISMDGHRKHNEVLQLHSESNRLRTQAAAQRVVSSNLFAWYQSKKNRQTQYEVSIPLAEGLPAGPNSDAVM